MLKYYENLKSWFEKTFPKIDNYTRAHRRVIKYIIAGSTAAWTNIGFLFIFVHFFGIYYITASVIAWVISFVVSFVLQKFWTFSSRGLEQAHRELVIYFITAVANLVVNTLMLYAFVEFLHIHYLISQIIIGLATAVVTYSINKFIIFKKTKLPGKYVILIAAAIYPPDPGGPATHAAMYERMFHQDGHEVRVAVFSQLNKFPPTIRHLIYCVLVFRKALGADLIYLQDAISTGPAAYVARLMGKKYIVRVGGDVVWERAAKSGKTKKSCLEFYATEKFASSRFFNIVKFVLNHAEKVIVPTKLLVDIYTKYYGIKSEEIIVIPNPIPVLPVRSHIKESAPAEGRGESLPAAERSVVFASRLVAYKNLDFVIKNWANINATLCILGDGPEARLLPKQQNVKILGTVSRQEKDEYLEKCMFTIAPALTEFNPNYVLEGFAMGKPTLMSRENGLPYKLPEIMLFDPRNEQEFISKLEYLLSDAGYKEAQAELAKLNFSQTWANVISRNLEIINSAVASA